MGEAVKKDVWFNLLPTLRGDRLYGLWDFLAIQISFGIAAWFFLVGGLTGLVVPASQAIPIVLFGNVIPLFLISPLAVIFARYGVEQFIGHRAVFGHRGGDIWFIIYITSSFGWIAYAALLMGSGSWKLAEILGVGGILATETPGMVIWAFLATIVGAYLAFRGPNVLKWAMRIGAAFLIIVLLYFIAVVFLVHGVEKTFAAPPPEPFEDPRWSIASAIEWNVGLGFSWAFWYGQWTRLARTERAAYHGTLWGWGILSCTAGIFAALTAIIVGSFDPTDWLVASQIAAVPVIGLAMIIVANVSSIALLIYPMSITFRSRFPNIKWGYVVGIMTLGGVLLELIPGVFDSYGIYLAYIALLTGIYGGVMIGDYLLTRGTYKLRALYNRSIGYRYVGGFNLNALIATIVAVAFYLWTLDPLTWTSANGLFPLITAGIPSYFLAMVVYILLTKSGIFGKAGAYMPGKTIPTPAAVAAVKTTDTSIDVKRS